MCMGPKIAGAILLTAILAGCAQTQNSASEGKLISPPQAVFMAATAAPEMVPGDFALQVRAAGRADGNVYLNSELDYRDQRNLSIAIAPLAQADLEKRYGQPPDQFFSGKAIVVHGAARRVKIFFLADGLPTDKYYYQTHVAVYDASQIALAEPSQPK